MGGKKKKGGKKGKKEGAEPRAQVSSTEQMAYKIQSLEAQLESARERVRRLGHDNEELRRTREKVEKDTHEFVAYFQKEMEKKDDLVADLRYSLRQAELAKEKELRETRSKLNAEMERQSNEYSATDRELRLKLKTVEEDLSMLYDFKAHKKELEAKLRAQEQQVRKEVQSVSVVHALTHVLTCMVVVAPVLLLVLLLLVLVLVLGCCFGWSTVDREGPVPSKETRGCGT